MQRNLIQGFYDCKLKIVLKDEVQLFFVTLLCLEDIQVSQLCKYVFTEYQFWGVWQYYLFILRWTYLATNHSHMHLVSKMFYSGQTLSEKTALIMQRDAISTFTYQTNLSISRTKQGNEVLDKLYFIFLKQSSTCTHKNLGQI